MVGPISCRNVPLQSSGRILAVQRGLAMPCDAVICAVFSMVKQAL